MASNKPNSSKDTSSTLTNSNISSQTTAVTEERPAASSSAISKVISPAKGKSSSKKKEQKPVHPLKAVVNFLGSLQLAVSLLTLFLLVVLLALVMETKLYNTKLAQELVYYSWWFNLILFLLSVNIFFAAVKKAKFNKDPLQIPKGLGYFQQKWYVLCHYWPWKRHQLGFLVTHLGLITLVAGGLVNGLSGTDAIMTLVDTSDPIILTQLQEFGEIPRASSYCRYADVSMIKVEEYPLVADQKNVFNPHGGTRKADQPERIYSGDFWGGALPWLSSDVVNKVKTDLFLTFMNRLHNPLGNYWTLDLGRDAKLEIIDFLPLAQRELYSADKKSPFAAFKVHLRSRVFNNHVWFTDYPGNGRSLGPLYMEVVGNCDNPLIGEFLHPPSLKEMGQNGILAIFYAGKTHRIPVALGKKEPVGNTDLVVKFDRVNPIRIPFFGERRLPLKIGPAIDFTLYRNGGANKVGSYRVFSRFTGRVQDLETLGQAKAVPPFWYHSSDVGAGQQGLFGVLQFVMDEDKNVYFRTYTKQGDSLALEDSGNAEVTQKIKVLNRMKWQFQIGNFLPNAKKEIHYSAVDIAPGKEKEEDRERFPSAVLCKLTVDGKEVEQFWIQKEFTPRHPKEIQVKDKVYVISYKHKEEDLGFTVKLERAEQKVDPGTLSPATYTSFVQLYDSKAGINGEHHVITMNEPLEYKGYKFFQSRYQDLGIEDSSGRPVSISTFSVASDPGLGLKYAGSILLGLGITLMFYMKSYSVTSIPIEPMYLNIIGGGCILLALIGLVNGNLLGLIPLVIGLFCLNSGVRGRKGSKDKSEKDIMLEQGSAT